MTVRFEFTDIRSDTMKYMRIFGQEAVDEIVKVMKKAGQEEVRNTRNRLQSRSTAAGDIYDKVAEEVIFDIQGGSVSGSRKEDLPILRFGAGEGFAGIKGSRGENIAGILAYGKDKATKEIPEPYSVFRMWKKLGRHIRLNPGYVSPEKKREEAFLPKAKDNIVRKLEDKIPEALRRAFGEVRF